MILLSALPNKLVLSFLKIYFYSPMFISVPFSRDFSNAIQNINTAVEKYKNVIIVALKIFITL